MALYMASGYECEADPVSAEMEKEDFQKEEWWVGVKRLMTSKGGFSLDDNLVMIKCHGDNESGAHPLAAEFAEEVWRIFSKYRESIESLAGFKKPGEIRRK